MTRTVPLLSACLAACLVACAPGPDVPRAVSLGARPLAGDIVVQKPEGCVGRVPGGWFAALCAEEMPPDFIVTLQRALAARGAYAGPLTGQLDAPTQAAIAHYQTPRGLPSETLSRRVAQQLGLVPWLD